MSDQAKQPAILRCFVVGPIGAAGTPEHDRADWLLEYIIKEALTRDPFNYKVERADEFTEPGLITDQVVNAVLTADLVVADLSGLNANAFYELGVRHMTGKPTIHMAAVGQALPFDVKDYRTIFYDLTSPHRAKEATKQLREQCESIMAAVASGVFQAQNPVSKAQMHQKLAMSADKKDHQISDLLSEIDRLNVELKRKEDEKERIKIDVASAVAKRNSLIDIYKSSNLDLSPGVIGAANIKHGVLSDAFATEQFLQNSALGRLMANEAARLHAVERDESLEGNASRNRVAQKKIKGGDGPSPAESGRAGSTEDAAGSEQ